MKKITVSILMVLFLAICFTPSYAGNKYVTAGGHFFATSERLLDQALTYYNRGDQVKLWTMVDSNMIKIFPPGVSVKIYTSGSYKIRVRVPRSSRTIWWTTRDALVHPSHRHLAK